jgi:Tol biopolymer transport system component
VSDGSRIYFTEYPPTRVSIAQVSSGGGEVANIDVPIENPQVADISPDQSELLITQSLPGATHYWSLPIPAGSPRQLGNLTTRDAAWTSEGKLIFTKGNDIFLSEHDGANPRKLVTAPGLPADPRFSPDGSRLRFMVIDQVNNTSALWEANADGSNLHELLPGWNTPPSECCGRWTPDGKSYVFTSTRADGTNIWIISERQPMWRKSSRDPVQLTTGPLQFTFALPSKDGKKLFVVGSQPRAELVRYDSRSGGFVPFLGGISAGDVDFSRDGQWVTYVTYPEDTLWRSKADGSERLQLTYPPMRAALAHWSPDGKQIAFSGSSPGKPWKIHLIPRDGGSPEALTSDEALETDPAWSADGKTIAFGHINFARRELTYISLFHVDTRQTSQMAGSVGIFAPRWSPDGRYVAAISYDNNKMMLYDVKIGTWRTMEIPLDSIGYLTWSRDSAYVYFDTFLSKDSGYYRVRISDSKVEKLADLKKLRQFNGQFGPGSWSGLGPGDVPLFPRNISPEEIYAFDLQLP